MKAIITQLSICPCGYPSCVETVGIGTEYEAMGTLDGLKYICWGCGKEQVVTGLLVMRGGGMAGYLPRDLFEVRDPNVKTFSV